MTEKIKVFVELLDEGSDTSMGAYAVPAENGLFRLLAPEDYNPELDLLAFAPGSLVKLKKAMWRGETYMAVCHPDPRAKRIFVPCSEKFAPEIRQTYGIEVEKDVYEIQPTPHYTPEQLWKFPPGTKVRLKKFNGPHRGDTYFVADERVE